MKDIYFIGEEVLFNEIKQARIDECYEYLKNKEEISLDIETTKKYNKYGDIEGLDPYTSKIVMLQIGDLERQYVIDVRNINPTELLKKLQDKIFIGHNLLFEYKHILHNYGIKLMKLYDTQIAEQVLFNGYPNKKFGLKSLINYYFKKDVNKDTRLEFLSIGSKPFTLTQIHYGAEDIIYPLKIKERQLEIADKRHLKQCMDFEFKFIPVLGDIEYVGLGFNQQKWLDVYKKKLIEWKTQEAVLNNFILENYSDSKFVNKQLSLFDSGLTCNIKWTSSKQVVEFFRYLDACPQEVSKTTKKLAYTVNATVVKSSLNTINKDKSDDIKSFIKKYLDFKELEQACTTFGEEFLKYVNPITQRLHSNYKQIVTTGRMSSSAPNLQNIPADKEYRECFDVPLGRKIVNADYSGQETVVLANKSGEPNIIKLINESGCMHSFVANKISGKPYEDFLNTLKKKDNHEVLNNYDKELIDIRQVAKSAGFAIQYGGTGFTIAKNLGIPEDEGDMVYEAYFKAFPELKKYFNRVQSDALRRGYILIDELTGRRAYFLPPQSMKEKHAIMKKALNYPIQGESGSITKLAGIFLSRALAKYSFNQAAIVNIVHDEISVECEEHLAEEIAKLVEKSMEDAGLMWCKTVPLKAKAAIVNYWNH